MKKWALFPLLAAGAAPWAHAQQEQARVLSATPIVQQVAVPQQVCGNETVYTGPRTSGGGAVLGAIAGGAAGNAIGGGSGRAAATAIGVIGGALLGNQIEGNGRPAYQDVQRCQTQTFYQNRTVGYNVVYEYAGRQYTTQTQSDPGRSLDVQVQPAGQTYSTQPDLSHGYPHPAPQGAIVQPGVVTSTYGTSYGASYGTPYGQALYPPLYSAPAPVYLSPPVTVELEYGQRWSRPYYGHGHPRHWR